METPKSGVASIDEYIAAFPPTVQEILQAIRATIHAAAPEATERIAYGMPTFYQNGNVVHFAAWKNHIGFYPAPSGISEFSEDLSKYAGDKGSVRFPMDEPMPLELITRIVQYRTLENIHNARAKAAKKKKA